MYLDRRLSMKKAELVGLLERVCQTLELSPAQAELARTRYEGVGAWLAEADVPLLKAIAIYLQGSTAIGTTVRPIGSNEHDVDLVAHMSELGLWVPPGTLKKVIGDRLKANGHYARILVEMARCWRLEYANEFHLDITPSIPNAASSRGGELVPDRTLKDWKASNPKGYKVLFLRRAELLPRMRLGKSAQAQDGVRADVEPYPAQSSFKSILPRSVQIAKRHRDVWFEHLDLDPSLIPISVIVTTLTSLSYEYCVTNFTYDGELDLLCDVIRHMPAFIETRTEFDERRWFIWNETTSGENFAEKWNREPARAEAFFTWHAQALRDMEELSQVDGINLLRQRLGDAFGTAPATRAIDALTNDISTARRAGRLVVAPSVGLAVGPLAASTPVRANTFFGR
jgi:Second Messenger Oligonucleotide or Dinucleotide Synthetase domain